MVVRRSFALLIIAFALFWDTAPAARAQNANARREFPPGVVRRPQDLPLSRFRTKVERLPAQAANRAMAWLANVHFTEQDLATLEVDPEGGVYYADAFQLAPVAAPADPTTSKITVPISPFPANLVFHSRPGAPNVIYLNFVGETVQNTAWNTDPEVNRAIITAVPFSADSDRTTFSDSEQLAIRRIWQRVSEDYSPFNVDVTTERPATFTTRTAEAVITRNTDVNGAANPASGAGGVAYVGVFATSSYATYRPAWIYDNNLALEESYIAEAVAHEIGHNMGLSHDGRTDGQGYYGGHGFGETSWGPIMGTGYGRNVSQWSKGDYYLANNTQDDLATIAGKLTYRTDDHGNTLSAATPLQIGGTGQIISTTLETDPLNASPVNKGVLERNTDVDWFSLPAGTGPVALTINPWITPGALTRGGDIDLIVELYDSAGTLLLTNNSASLTGATIATNLTEGIYYIAVRNTAAGDPYSSSPYGYTSYGGVGEYYISGTVIPSGVVIPPGAELTASDFNQIAVSTYTFSVTYTDNSAIDVSSIDGNDIRVTGPNGYSRTATLVSINNLTNGPLRVATYSITSPGGTWVQHDNGLYTVSILPNQVADVEGAFVAPKALGQFTVAIPTVLYSQTMDTNPGWTFQGLWQYGRPNYTVTTAPKTGFTGTNIIAYNLSGNYENRLTNAVYATTPPINCVGSTALTLKFRRWLRLRSNDTANIQVSTNGTTWTSVWSTTLTVADTSWQEVQYSLPAVALGSSTVRLRWGLASGQNNNDIGWNIDDVTILGNSSVDTTPPLATINAPNLLNGGSPVHSFTVTYSDDIAIRVASLSSSNLYVLGPNGSSNAVEFAGVDVSTDGAPRTATYNVSAPNGIWSSLDNGEYQIFLLGGEVTDTSNNSLEEQLLGKFTVAIAESHQAIIVDPITVNLLEGSMTGLTVRLAEAPLTNVTVTIHPLSGDTNAILIQATSITFDPSSWPNAAPIIVQALSDTDRVDAVATFELRSVGLPSVSVTITATDTTPLESHQALIVNSTNLTLLEGSESSFTIRLAEAPLTNVIVTIHPASGDTNVIVPNVTPIIFTPLNWSNAIPVSVTALPDADRLDANATIECRSDGLASISVLVTAPDTTPNPNIDPPKIGSITFSNLTFQIVAAAETGVTCNLEASSDFVEWDPIDSQPALAGSVTFITPPSTNSSLFYRIKQQ